MLIFRVFDADSDGSDGARTSYLVLLCDELLPIRGKASLRVLFGHVSVLGHDIRASDRHYPVYSPNTHCFMTLRARQHEQNFLSKSLPKTIPKVVRKKLVRVMNAVPNASILQLSWLESRVCDFLVRLPKYANLFLKLGDVPEHALSAGVSLILQSDVKLFRESSEFSDARQHVMSACRTSECVWEGSRSGVRMH